MENRWTAALLVGVFTTVCVFIFNIWWYHRRLRQLGEKIPGPKGIPLLGNALQIIKGPEKTFSFFYNSALQHQGSPFRMWVGPMLIIFITTAEDAEILLVKERLINRDEYLIKILRKRMGNGLVTCREDTWKKQRKIVAPTFQSGPVESYMGIFNKHAHDLVNHLTQFADGRTFDVNHLLGVCAVGSILETTVGNLCEGQNTAVQVFLDAMAGITRFIYHLYVQPWLRLQLVYNMTAVSRRERKMESTFFSLVNSEIHNKMEEFYSRGSSDETYEEKEKNKKFFIDQYIKSAEDVGLPLSEEQFQGDMRTLIMVGQETTATTLSFALVLLSLHPEVQDGLYQELKDVFADDWDRPVTVSDIKRLHYMGRVIKETMRLYPNPLILLREVHKDIKLTNYTLPAGSKAWVWPFMIHRDPRYFQNPERFDPDRFLPEQCKGRHPYSYIPFGAGPRNCVGYRFAEMQMPVILAMILKSYQILPACTHDDLQRLEFSVILTPSNGYKVKMVPR